MCDDEYVEMEPYDYSWQRYVHNVPVEDGFNARNITAFGDCGNSQIIDY